MSPTSFSTSFSSSSHDLLQTWLLLSTHIPKLSKSCIRADSHPDLHSRSPSQFETWSEELLETVLSFDGQTHRIVDGSYARPTINNIDHTTTTTNGNGDSSPLAESTQVARMAQIALEAEKWDAHNAMAGSFIRLLTELDCRGICRGKSGGRAVYAALKAYFEPELVQSGSPSTSLSSSPSSPGFTHHWSARPVLFSSFHHTPHDPSKPISEYIDALLGARDRLNAVLPDSEKVGESCTKGVLVQNLWVGEAGADAGESSSSSSTYASYALYYALARSFLFSRTPEPSLDMCIAVLKLGDAVLRETVPDTAQTLRNDDAIEIVKSSGGIIDFKDTISQEHLGHLMSFLDLLQNHTQKSKNVIWKRLRLPMRSAEADRLDRELTLLNNTSKKIIRQKKILSRWSVTGASWPLELDGWTN
ncbi:hypothetical protein F5878DRAFT_42414 [Lentinula raphanica]|uniref:Uncharacterized protein n=1 Tax=Lentinula raphanica TaxID=153919 RepID=A0AA38UGI0_9AGAR|nr:hypothetical protein F5878DRAFT_42414 [Lentinula raphanica]